MFTLLSASLGTAWLGIRAFVPGVNIVFWLRAASYVIVSCFALYGGVKFSNWRHSDKLTQKEAKLQCNTVMLLAAHQARESALRRLSIALKKRSDEVASDESRIREEDRTLREARDATQQNDLAAVCVPTDDEWLRRYQKR